MTSTIQDIKINKAELCTKKREISVTKRRNKGAGGVRFRQDTKRWEVTVDFGKDQNGERKRITRTGKTKSEAIDRANKAIDEYFLHLEKMLDQQQEKKEGGNSSQICLGYNENDLKLENWYKIFVNRKKRGYLKDSSVSNYAASYHKIVESGIFSDLCLNQISFDHIEDLGRYMILGEHPIRKKTAKIYLNHLSQALDYAVEKQLIERNVMSGRKLDLPREITESKKVLTREIGLEETKLLLEASKEEGNLLIYTVIFTLMYTGLRIGELAGLKIDNVNEKKNYIIIDHQISDQTVISEDLNTYKVNNVISDTKTETSNRIIYLDKERKVITALKMLFQSYRSNDILMKKIYENGTEDFIFVNNWGNFFTGVRLYSRLRDFGKRHGFDDIHPHRFRHTFTSIMARSNIQPTLGAKILGHSSTDMYLKVYTDVTDNDKKQATEQINNYLCNTIFQNNSQ